MYKSLALILFMCSLCLVSESAKILAIFSAPSVSHKAIFSAYIHALLKKGHHVTVVTPDVDYPKNNGPANLTEINIHNMTYRAIKEDMIKLKRGEGTSMHNHFSELYRMVNILGDRLFRSKRFKELLHKQKFDLVIIEEFHEVLLSITNVFRVPVIQMSSLGSTNGYETIGAPINPLLYPEVITQRIRNLSVWEEIKESFAYLSLKHIQGRSIRKFESMLKSKLPNTPPLDELRININTLFLNTNPIWEENRPVPTGVIYTFGIHKKKAQGLPEDLKKFLDKSDSGVIYVSFGTNVRPSTLPEHKVRILMKVLSQVPYDVLLKWDTEAIVDLPKNVKVKKWFPQIDILRHKNVKLFISQGGKQSTEEAIDAGVPLLGIPMMFDQWSNAEKYVRYNIGKKIEIEKVTEEELRHAIEVVARDDSYRNNTRRLRGLLRDHRHNGLHLAVWWTEYILKHGDSHLHCPAADVSWSEYIELELIFIIFFSIILLLVFIVVSTFFAAKYYKKRKELNLDLGTPYTVRFTNRKFI